MSEFWYDVIKSFQAYFKPGQDITIDEKLFGAKVRSPFTQYLPTEPDKFGIKNWMAVFNESKYMLNCIPYLGKDETRPAKISLREHVVRKLIDP